MSLRLSASSSWRNHGWAWPTALRCSCRLSNNCRAAAPILRRWATRRCITPAPRSRPQLQSPANPAPICEDMNEAPTVFQRRIIIGAVLCTAAFALVGIRLVHVTLLKSLDAGHAAVVVATRADLTDRNGRLLARDHTLADLYARPNVFWDKAQAARDLAQATCLDAQRLL